MIWRGLYQYIKIRTNECSHLIYVTVTFLVHYVTVLYVDIIYNIKVLGIQGDILNTGRDIVVLSSFKQLIRPMVLFDDVT